MIVMKIVSGRVAVLCFFTLLFYYLSLNMGLKMDGMPEFIPALIMAFVYIMAILMIHLKFSEDVERMCFLFESSQVI